MNSISNFYVSDSKNIKSRKKDYAFGSSIKKLIFPTRSSGARDSVFSTNQSAALALNQQSTPQFNTEPLSSTHRFSTRTTPFQHPKSLNSTPKTPQFNTKIPQFHTKNPSFPTPPQYHTKNPSVQHQNPSSSTSKTPQSHTKNQCIFNAF